VIVAAGGTEREALAWLDGRPHWPGVEVFVVGADPGRRLAIETLARGASDYFVLPEDLEILSNAAGAAIARGRERRAQTSPPESGPRPEAFAALVGESPALRAVLARAGRLLPHDATTLVLGETGTGKEVLARALHEGGPRRHAPFVPVNCAALPGTLIESELFGHERGAFTDAHAAKPGLFEVAAGGTLFLDEIGTLAPDVQAKLLRVLDDGVVRRVGGTRARTFNVRIIAATNEDLAAAVRQGAFREDLFYRLNVITHVLPPLRERDQDVILIARHLLHRLAAEHGLPEPQLGVEARSALLGHHWPGNVRELKNAVERALFLSAPGPLRSEDLISSPSAPPPVGNGALPFPATLRRITAAAASATLARCGGNRSEAARQLAVSRRRLARLLAASTQNSREIPCA